MFPSTIARSIAASVLLILVGTAGAAAIEAPAHNLPEVNVEAFVSHLQDYFARYADKTPADLVRDRVATAALTKLRWEVREVLGQHPQGFEEFGLVVSGDRAIVSIDLQRFPQWQPLSDRLSGLNDPATFRAHVRAWRERGFRDQDFVALKKFLAANDLDPMKYRAYKARWGNLLQHLPSDRELSDAFIERLKATVYESTLEDSEQNRAWAHALLESLEPQAQQILVSTFHQTQDMTFIARDVGKQLREQFAAMRSGEYMKFVREEDERRSKPRLPVFAIDESLPPEEEPKDPAWSGQMEQRLNQYLTSHPLAERFHIISIDCRTSFCELKADGRVEDDAPSAFVEALDEMQRQAGWGVGRGAGGSAPSRDPTRMEIREELRRQ